MADKLPSAEFLSNFWWELREMFNIIPNYKKIN